LAFIRLALGLMANCCRLIIPGLFSPWSFKWYHRSLCYESFEKSKDHAMERKKGDNHNDGTVEHSLGNFFIDLACS
jgi:hypothetical protein